MLPLFYFLIDDALPQALLLFELSNALDVYGLWRKLSSPVHPDL
jgi:hypothetical protein